MHYVICYDIADDRRRYRLQRALLDYGTRVQESVFIATLRDSLFREMRRRIEPLIDPTLDSLLVFPNCARCSTDAVRLGCATLPEESDFYLV